jgi:hypothetical protein
MPRYLISRVYAGDGEHAGIETFITDDLAQAKRFVSVARHLGRLYSDEDGVRLPWRVVLLDTHDPSFGGDLADALAEIEADLERLVAQTYA